MDYHQKLDNDTKIQLIIIKLDELEARFNSLKIPDQSELLKVITELSNSISNLAARIKIIEEKKIPIELEIIQKQILELRKRIEDMEYNLKPKSVKSLWKIFK